MKNKVETNLIHRIVWNYYLTTGIDIQELRSEAYLGYAEALVSFDPNKKTKETTYIWRCVCNKLNSFIQQEQKRKQFIFLFEDLNIFSNIYSFSEENKKTTELLLKKLSKDALDIAKMILLNEEEFERCPPKIARGEIGRIVLSAGWTHKRKEIAFKELRNLINEKSL